MERSGFFDSEVVGQNPDGSPIYDREYLSEFFALYFSSFIGNGVFPNPATGLQVIANNNMTVILKLGKAWINGYFYENTDNLALNIDVADGVLNRVDRIVLRLDFLTREIKAVVKKGDFASNAIAKALQRDADAYEIALADINISKGIISISQANIIDLRLNKDLCGIVHGTVEQVDTTAIFNQYLDWYNAKTGQYQADMSNMEAQFQSNFNNWFNSIKGQLSGDIAGNLLNLINENVDKIGILNTDFNSHKVDDTKHIDYAVASGTNTYTATITNIATLTEGLSVKIKFTNANTGVSTLNLNSLGAKTIQKGNGNVLSSGNIKAGQICHLVYTGSVFQLLGEGGEYGSAIASQVLAPNTIGTETGIVTGTMPNRTFSANNNNYTNAVSAKADGGGSLCIVPLEGYYKQETNGAGFGSILAWDANLIASNILSGKSIFGLAGSATVSSLGGKRYATGSVMSDAKFQITVSTNFKPSVILVWKTGTNTVFSWYFSATDISYNYYVQSISPPSATVNTYAVFINGNYINETGFKIEVRYDNYPLNYIAYE